MKCNRSAAHDLCTYNKRRDPIVFLSVDGGGQRRDTLKDSREDDFTYFELWHHWGRTAKFGVWMQGPDYTQWHGAYEVLSDLVELRKMTADLQQGEPISRTITITGGSE